MIPPAAVSATEIVCLRDVRRAAIWFTRAWREGGGNAYMSDVVWLEDMVKESR